MPEWVGDVGPIILATVVIITTIWQMHTRTHDKLENNMNKRFDKVEDRLSRIEQDMSEMKGMLKVFINGKHKE